VGRNPLVASHRVFNLLLQLSKRFRCISADRYPLFPIKAESLICIVIPLRLLMLWTEAGLR